VKHFLLPFILIATSFFTGHAQTFHVGVNVSYGINYLLNKNIPFEGQDTVYVFSKGSGLGIQGAYYFDFGGYYYRKMFGIKTEVNWANVNQSYKVFPGSGPANPNTFYQYEAKLKYIDVPLMFTFCPTHHQGFTLDVGPQISFLQSARVIPEESRIQNPLYPNLDKGDFQNITYSAVLGMGCFYNFTESFALQGSFRFGYGFSDLTKATSQIPQYQPTHRAWFGSSLQAIYKFNKYTSSRNRGYKYYAKRLRKR